MTTSTKHNRSRYGIQWGNFDDTKDLMCKFLSLHARDPSSEDVPSKRAKRMAEDVASVVATSHRVAASTLRVAQAVSEP